MSNFKRWAFAVACSLVLTSVHIVAFTKWVQL